MNQTDQFHAWTLVAQQRTEQALAQHLPDASEDSSSLHAAMRYASLGGGKRLRALLAYAAAEFVEAPVERADRVAAAVECMHAYSLIHDDLPCMDDDDLRRGKPSCHKQFDEATALLAGDALQTLAFEMLSAPDWHTQTQQQLSMLHLLAIASGAQGMAGGQAIDLANVGKTMTQDELERMHRMKTGALIEAATLLGAYCADHLDKEMQQALQRYAHQIGLAFQVVDDILDTVADTATLGKTAGKDIEQNKPTYVSLMGLTQAQVFAKQLIEDACSAITPYGQQSNRLIQIAHFIAQRAY
ncbi:MAG: polyprenyl synthetase family protein [Methylophilaceae bacterium]